MTLPRKLPLLSGLILCWAAIPSIASPGFASRDLNPVLQSIFLPGFKIHGSKEAWQIDHSLYITNTHQRQDRGIESLVIDVENYRYKLDLSYRHQEWVYQASLPWIANQRGKLDSLIEGWHKTFGLPQGNRRNFPKEQIDIDYEVMGVSQYSQFSSSSGLGDIAVAISYQPPDHNTGYFFGFELPTGSVSDFSGNEAVDSSIWATRIHQIDPELVSYALVGVSFPGNGGNLKNLVVDHIWLAQLGITYNFHPGVESIIQLDFHSQSIKNSALDAFGNSLQIQLGIRFDQLIDNHKIDLFFSEDILVGSTPDISFGINLGQSF